ncbi:MAG: hypothetical protein OXU23_13970 [Candidatus Poribacteria bacterium]|nr:hypothetical protein [Candidatus Poribacteria bacterium]
MKKTPPNHNLILITLMKHTVSTTNTVIISFFIFCYTGCGFLDDYEEYGGSPHEAYILSISDSRPAEVTIGWMYMVFGCDNVSGATAERNSNNIYLTINGEGYTGSADCDDGSRQIWGKVTVKNLEVGEYIIKEIYDNRELGRFRIEPDTGYMFIASYTPVFMVDPIDLNNDEPKRNTYQVKVRMHLEGYYEIGYEPIFKIDVERTQDVINIEAWQVIPKKNGQIILDPSGITADQHERKHIDIDLGTFSTGSYTAIINGVEYTFEVLPGTY